MKAKEMYLGGWVTSLVNLIAIGSADGEEIQKGGFVLAMLIILAVSCGIRLMVASAAKEKEDSDAPTNWTLLGHYSIGAAISTAVTLLIFLLA